MVCLWRSVSTGPTLELVVLLIVTDEVEEVTLMDIVEDEEVTVPTEDDVDEELVGVDPCPVVHCDNGGGFWNT